MKRFLILMALALVLMPACNKNELDNGLSTYVFHQHRSEKRGVFFNSHTNAAQLVPQLDKSVSWCWAEAALPATPPAQSDVCPMLKDGQFNADDIRTYKRAHPQTRYLFSFYEPNRTEQANLTPAQAAALWPGVVSLATELGLKLLAPTLAAGNLAGYEDPAHWLEDFLAQPEVSLDQISGISLAVSATSVGELESFINSFGELGKPLWITVQGGSDLGFMSEALNMLEASEKVFRYAWDSASLESGTTSFSAPCKVFVHFSSFDKSVYFKAQDVIPAEEYANALGYVHLGPSTDDSVLEISEIGKGGYVEYQLNLLTSGTYDLHLRCKTRAQAEMSFYLNENKVAAKLIPNTNGAWTICAFDLVFPAGKSVLRIMGDSMETVALNWLWIK